MAAPLHLTKIAFGAKSYADIESWFAGRQRVSLTTRYCPKRVEELAAVRSTGSTTTPLSRARR